jgi:hypothetical protein
MGDGTLAEIRCQSAQKQNQPRIFTALRGSNQSKNKSKIALIRTNPWPDLSGSQVTGR